MEKSLILKVGHVFRSHILSSNQFFNHDLLIVKLFSVDFPKWSIATFQSFLSGRVQCVRLNDEESDYLPVHVGIHQGSALGPLLFTFFLNDFDVLNDKYCSLYKYADDQTLLCPDKPPQLAQAEVEHLENW